MRRDEAIDIILAAAKLVDQRDGGTACTTDVRDALRSLGVTPEELPVRPA